MGGVGWGWAVVPATCCQVFVYACVWRAVANDVQCSAQRKTGFVPPQKKRGSGSATVIATSRANGDKPFDKGSVGIPLPANASNVKPTRGTSWPSLWPYQHLFDLDLFVLLCFVVCCFSSFCFCLFSLFVLCCCFVFTFFYFYFILFWLFGCSWFVFVVFFVSLLLFRVFV